MTVRTMRITAPVTDYNGPGPGGIVFTDGVAESSDGAVIGYCQGAGYTVESLDDDAPPSPVPEPKKAPQAKPAGPSPSKAEPAKTPPTAKE